MTDPIDLEALRAALAVIQRETVRAGGVSFSDGRDLIATHAAVSAALAELTTRRARDAEVAELVEAAKDARCWVREYMDQNDCPDDDPDLDVSACVVRLDAALFPFRRSVDKGDAT